MRLSSWLVVLSVLVGCRDSGAAPIRIVLGPAAADDVTLVPLASLAELIEIDPTQSALLLTLTSAERGCDATTEPDPNATGVALRLVLPAGSKLQPGSYPIVESSQASDKPHVLATVKLRGRRQELRPGGDLLLSQIDSNPQGALEGVLRLEFTGDAEHPATRVSGRFLAHFCRINRLR